MCGVGDALAGSTMLTEQETLIAGNYVKIAARPQRQYHAIVSNAYTTAYFFIELR